MFAVVLVAATLVAGMGRLYEVAAAEVIKIGTVAPKASPWGQVFEVWAKAVDVKTQQKGALQFAYDEPRGESAMVDRIKPGQLDGAAVTAAGLAKVYKPLLALQMPGLFTDATKFDAACTAITTDFDKGVGDAGFRLVGWAHHGWLRTFSRGVALKSPADLKGRKPWVWRGDVSQPVFFQVVGVAPVPLNLSEVLASLNTGAIDVVTAQAIWVEQLKWTTRLDHVGSSVSGPVIGAVVLSAKRLDALPSDLRTAVMDTGKVAAARLTKRLRDEDAAALARLKAKMTVVTLSTAEETRWTESYKLARQRLGQKTFSADLVTRLEQLAK